MARQMCADLFFDCAADLAKMLAKGQSWIRRTSRKEIRELQLGTQGRASSHLICLGTLCVANRPCGRCDLLHTLNRHEEHTVFITHCHIVDAQQPGPDASRAQSVRFPFPEAKGAGWECSEAEHRKANLQ